MDWSPWLRQPALGGPDRPATASDALARLVEGNRRFADFAAGVDARPAGRPPKQTPFGVILGCSDARVPLELVYGAAPNELFIVRVAGNVLGDECLGSIEYALANFTDSVKVLAVTGHTACGAVTAAVDTYLSPKHASGIAFSRSLRSVVNHILVAVRSAALSLEQVHGVGVLQEPNYRDALLELAVPLNAAINAYQLRAEIHAHDLVEPKVVYGVFDLTSSRVCGPHEPEGVTLSPAPSTPGELVEIGVRLAASPAVVRHLRPISGPPPETE